MHIKRSLMPITWPVARKTNTKRYIAVPSHSKTKSITLLYVLRDILKIAKTRKEVNKILYNKNVEINGIIRTDDCYPVHVLDTLSLTKLSKHYRLQIVNKKFKLNEISSKDATEKIVKIIGKKVLKNKKIQVNFEDGYNFEAKEKFNVGDSAILNQKEGKIVKILPLRKGAKIEIISGKHAGKKGEFLDFERLSRGKNYKIKLEDGLEVNLPYKTMLVIG